MLWVLVTRKTWSSIPRGSLHLARVPHTRFPHSPFPFSLTGQMMVLPFKSIALAIIGESRPPPKKGS